ncbi:BTB and MATH domain-containing protein 36 [Exaiptasia diaphana]|uniref:BTB domain-containing protein n=1 Tax=Exaiptasia diaphana TaxID=2652724 RepID=A0A913WRU4_EXADI|nr:BTB and MATH domain-containing protein 36 [Exaiptasia diaphana]KXJ28032.1 BTB and MATH domain-containing protein 36 [Exaiptasia diaphana]
MQKKGSEPSFEDPWHMSDVILCVEDKRFHVHKSTLSMWSPVFEKMFTSPNIDRTGNEITLHGKKSNEIKDMLLVIYPTSKKVTEENCYYLLSLAQEYQMEQLSERCESYLLRREKTPFQAIDFLVIAHTFNMTELRRQCIEIAKHMSLSELRKHEKYLQIEPEYGRQLAERRIEMLELKVSALEGKANSARKELKESCETAVKDLGRFYYRQKYPDGRQNLRAYNECSRLLEEVAHEDGGVCVMFNLLQQKLKKIYEPQHM